MLVPRLRTFIIPSEVPEEKLRFGARHKNERV